MSPPPQSYSVGWVVDTGVDFPPDLRTLIANWDTRCDMRERPSKLTTRAWNGYGENEKRDFKFTTAKSRLDAESLNQTFLRSKSFHMVCTPERCINLVKSTMRRRKELNTVERPVFVWEPVPDLCTPEELASCFEALKQVEVVSPNHAELCGFFGKSAYDTSGSLDKQNVYDCVNEWLRHADREHLDLKIVVRVGRDGCYYAGGEESGWVPAYHQNTEKVVDPTGAGNAFLGGLAIGLVRAKSQPSNRILREACMYGSVAASYAVEQVGVPELAKNELTGETWNGTCTLDRLDSFKQRCGF